MVLTKSQLKQLAGSIWQTLYEELFDGGIHTMIHIDGNYRVIYDFLSNYANELNNNVKNAHFHCGVDVVRDRDCMFEFYVMQNDPQTPYYLYDGDDDDEVIAISFHDYESEFDFKVEETIFEVKESTT
jgi:hypothetical protein